MRNLIMENKNIDITKIEYFSILKQKGGKRKIYGNEPGKKVVHEIYNGSLKECKAFLKALFELLRNSQLDVCVREVKKLAKVFN